MDFSNESEYARGEETSSQQPTQTTVAAGAQGTMQAPPPQQPPAPPSPKKGKKKWVAFFSVIGILLFCVAISFSSDFFGTDTSQPYASGEENVRVIDIVGTIEATGETYNQSFINEMIESAKNDEDNVAIMLLIDSPGGGVYESDETYLKLMDYKKTTKRPVYAYCQSMCASGGYYIASSADKIYANRNALVGSIGVICGQFVDATELLDKLGVKITTPHSGANKLMGSLSEAPTEEQVAIMQGLSDEAYEQFVDIVAKGRNLSVADTKKLADGRIYSAKQCVANGLIDHVGTIEDFDAMLKDTLGEDIVFYHEVYEEDFYSLLYRNMNSFFGKRHGQTELGETLAIIDELNITEPMYLYLD